MAGDWRTASSFSASSSGKPDLAAWEETPPTLLRLTLVLIALSFAARLVGLHILGVFIPGVV